MKKYILITCFFSTFLLSCSDFVNEFNRSTENLKKINDIIEGENFYNNSIYLSPGEGFASQANNKIKISRSTDEQFSSDLVVKIESTNLQFIDTLVNAKSALWIREGASPVDLDLVKIENGLYKTTITLNENQRVRSYDVHVTSLWKGMHTFTFFLDCKTENCEGEAIIKFSDEYPQFIY